MIRALSKKKEFQQNGNLNLIFSFFVFCFPQFGMNLMFKHISSHYQRLLHKFIFIMLTCRVCKLTINHRDAGMSKSLGGDDPMWLKYSAQFG